MFASEIDGISTIIIKLWNFLMIKILNYGHGGETLDEYFEMKLLKCHVVVNGSFVLINFLTYQINKIYSSPSAGMWLKLNKTTRVFSIKN